MELLKEEREISGVKLRGTETAYSDGDIIVPDVKPDILKILQVDAVCAVTSKEVTDGCVTVSGIVKYNILYIPEKEDFGLQSIPAEESFRLTVNNNAVTASSLADVFTDVERVEFSLLNSRKLNIKTAVLADYAIWENKEITVSTGINCEEAEVLCKNLSVRGGELLTEHSFVVRDRLELPSGRAPVSEILKIDIDVCDREIKAITGKAVIKANLSVCALYTDADGEIAAVSGEIPITEIAESFELTEDAPCNVEYRICDYSFQADTDADGDARYINLDISLLAVITSSENTQLKVMQDCFCPGRHTDAVYGEQSFEEVVQSLSKQYTIHESLAPDKKQPQIASVYNVLARPDITRVSSQNGKTVVEGRLELCVLYITDNAQLPVYSIKKDVPLKFTLDSEDCDANVDCEASIQREHISFNLNMAQEAEVRCILSVNVNLKRRVSINTVCECNFSDKSDDCGIAIYFVRPGDTLWQIAKKYCISVSDIAQLNDLRDENSLTPGEKLIIPFC